MLTKLSFLKKILFPSFLYHFDISLVDLHFSPQLKKKLDILEANVICHTSSGFQFKIKTSQLLKRFAFGQLIATITYTETDRFSIDLEFWTQKIAFLIIATVLSLSLSLSALIVKEYMLAKLITIPVIFMFGHVVFWGSIPANVKRLKKFFIELAE